MKFMKSLVAAALVLAGTSAFAAGVKTIDVDTSGQAEGLRIWSSQCVGNVGLDQDVTIQYRYGDEANAQWTELKIEKDTVMLFREHFDRNSDPLKLTVKFMTKATDGAELSYDLADTLTALRPAGCRFVENYRFQATDAGDGSIDLLHVQ